MQFQTDTAPRVQPTAQQAHKPAKLPRVHSTPDIPTPRQATKTRFGRTSFPPLRYQPETLNAVLNTDTGDLEEFRQLRKGKNAAKWINGNSKEVARLCRGRKQDNIKGSSTILWMKPSELPKGRTATYLRIVAAYRPQKDDPFRIRWTVGGDRVNYPGIVTTPSADITTQKLLYNSIISTPNAAFFDMDIENFYLNTEMDRPEYMWVARVCVVCV